MKEDHLELEVSKDEEKGSYVFQAGEMEPYNRR
jgi:hypothetical protein